MGVRVLFCVISFLYVFTGYTQCLEGRDFVFCDKEGVREITAIPFTFSFKRDISYEKIIKGKELFGKFVEKKSEIRITYSKGEKSFVYDSAVVDTQSLDEIVKELVSSINKKNEASDFLFEFGRCYLYSGSHENKIRNLEDSLTYVIAYEDEYLFKYMLIYFEDLVIRIEVESSCGKKYFLLKEKLLDTLFVIERNGREEVLYPWLKSVHMLDKRRVR
jgi:hypothetical protein